MTSLRHIRNISRPGPMHLSLGALPAFVKVIGCRGDFLLCIVSSYEQLHGHVFVHFFRNSNSFMRSPQTEYTKRREYM